MIGQESMSGAKTWKRYFYKKAFGLTQAHQTSSPFISKESDLGKMALNFFERFTLKNGKYGLLAIDRAYDEAGNPLQNKTVLYVSNETVFQMAKTNSHFFPIFSIHPYRHDALDELDKWADQGGRLLKWLPNEMNIDPSHSLCLPFFKKMVKRNLILLTHGGKESAIPSINQELGNPLLLRNALDSEVKVIIAHCATLGKGRDFDHNTHNRIANFDLFLRLMHEEKYQHLLFGDLAAITQINRMRYLPKLLELTQPGQLLSQRLVHGSDYPLTNMRFLYSLNYFKFKSYITKEEKESLEEIFKINPLLFDVVLKRTVKHPQTRARFPINLFIENRDLFSTITK